MSENEIAVGTALVPLEEIEQHREVAYMARRMMEIWERQHERWMAPHELALLRRQIVNMGELEAFLSRIEAQHREWISDLTGEPLCAE